MKKKMFTLMLLMTMICGAMAQNDAMYVYRNDGLINAFLKADIDSVCYSQLDLDSVSHSEYVVQEVWAVDSVYRIPLAVIDSVGFVTPKTVYKNNVVIIEGAMRKYIIGRKELTLLFSLDTPLNVLPSQGEKLLSTVGDEYLQSAFVGKVTRINRTDTSIEVICDPVALTEVFERYYGISSIEVEQNEAKATRAITGTNQKDGVISPGKLSRDLINMGLPASVSYSVNDILSFGVDDANARLTLAVTPVIKYSAYSIIEPGFPINLGVTVTGDYRIDEELELAGTVSGECDVKLWNKGIPIPEALVDINLELGVFLRANAGITVEKNFTQNYRSAFHWEWASDGNESVKNINRFFPVSSSQSGIIALNGSVGAGAYGKIGLAFIATSSLDIAEVNLRLEGGVKAEGTWVPYLKDKEKAKTSTELYEQLKNKKVGKYWFYGLSGEATLFNWSVSHAVPDLGNIKLNNQGIIEEYNAVPLFKNTKLTSKSKGQLLAETEVSGIVQPMKIGFALFANDEMNDGEYKYTISGYDGSALKMSELFNSSKTGKGKVYPLVKFGEMDILASPSAELNTGLPKITNFKQTGSQYSNGAYYNDGRYYDYKYEVSTTVEIESLDGVADWGYVYKDPYGNIKRISLMGYGTSYTDTRYAYYRNEAKSTACLYGYVKYEGNSEYYYDEPQDYPLEYAIHTCPDSNHPHAIDLGLPSGTKWACCNVGASSPEEYGGFYAWGETSEKSVYNEDTYAYYTYYNNSSVGYYTDIGSDIAGTSYDVAHVRMGAPWRMPNKEQPRELFMNCSVTWTQWNGVNGILLTGKNGGRLFLPAAGVCWGEVGSIGFYWSSCSPWNDANWPSLIFSFSSDGWSYLGVEIRCCGCSVRAVCP